MRRRWTSESPAATLALGRAVGSRAGAGLVIGLDGELGAGKTLFTRGLHEGLGLPEAAWSGSPTFVLASRYRGSPGLLHADFYRLGSPREVADLGLVDAAREGAVVVVEWSEQFPSELPAERLRIRFTVLDGERRQVELEAWGSAAEGVLAAVLPESRGGGRCDGEEQQGDAWR